MEENYPKDFPPLKALDDKPQKTTSFLVKPLPLKAAETPKGQKNLKAPVLERDSKLISAPLKQKISPTQNDPLTLASRGKKASEGNREKLIGYYQHYLLPWVQASRPAFFVATLFPCGLGFILAWNSPSRPEVSIVKFILILIACFLVHLATNIANDFFEYREGIDKQGTIGGSRVLQEGKLSVKAILTGILICYLTAFVLAIIIINVYKNPLAIALWALVLFAALSSFFYVAPPIKYGHRALGELMVFVNMGLIIVVGTFMALTGSFQKDVVAIALPLSFMVASILYFQSLPEIVTDELAGKKTLAGVLGKEGASLVYLLWYPVVWLLILVLYLCGKLSAWALLALLTVPIHIFAYLKIRRADDWLTLDKSGYLVRLLYVGNNIFLLLGALL
ncbi:MAG: prenyltransferase [Deltaproteobacteria bacterium]|jgi:1,4-dihydroxy-2-naphthoate octaprenyltransferase|nr:prenyltransferase [Deltaproteobacteria bacterium]